MTRERMISIIFTAVISIVVVLIILVSCNEKSINPYRIDTKYLITLEKITDSEKVVIILTNDSSCTMENNFVGYYDKQYNKCQYLGYKGTCIPIYITNWFTNK